MLGVSEPAAGTLTLRPTPPPHPRPQSRRVAGVSRSVGGTRGPIITISPRPACALPHREENAPRADGTADRRKGPAAPEPEGGGRGDARWW